MRIAFARFNQNTDLDYAVASVASRNTEERVGVLEALVEHGHEVTIVSFIAEKHRHALKGESEGPFDNSWMTALRWTMKPNMQRYDLLIVETAAGNSMYQYHYKGESVSYIQHFADILRRTQGGPPILIFHVGMGGLAFPFARLSCLFDEQDEAYNATLSPLNYRNIFKDLDIWDGFEWTLWSKAYSSQLFVEAFKNFYGRKELKLSRYVNTPIGYSERYDFCLPPRIPEESEYDLVYVGRADNPWRKERIHHFYDSEEYNALLVGKGWDKESWRNGNIDAPGQSKYHGDVQDHYRRGLACILCLDPELAQSGMCTTRHIQSIRSGCVTMVDKYIRGGEEWVGGEDFQVSSQDDVVRALDEYCSTKKRLAEANEFQKSKLVQWFEIIPYVLDVGVGKEKGEEVNVGHVIQGKASVRSVSRGDKKPKSGKESSSDRSRRIHRPPSGEVPEEQGILGQGSRSPRTRIRTNISR